MAGQPADSGKRNKTDESILAVRGACPWSTSQYIIQRAAGETRGRSTLKCATQARQNYESQGNLCASLSSHRSFLFFFFRCRVHLINIPHPFSVLFLLSSSLLFPYISLIHDLPTTAVLEHIPNLELPRHPFIHRPSSAQQEKPHIKMRFSAVSILALATVAMAKSEVCPCLYLVQFPAANVSSFSLSKGRCPSSHSPAAWS